jgi:hypothetical protein
MITQVSAVHARMPAGRAAAKQREHLHDHGW